MAGDRLGILLDLDDTLVLTSRLEPLRVRRAWPAVYAAFSETDLPPGTREFVASLLRHGDAGVVTSAPRTYAERLLAHHGLVLPVLVAYHDTARHKPLPDPLLEGARRLGVLPERCVHIGDAGTDDQAARAAGMASIRVAWGVPPTGEASSWAEVLTRVSALGPQ